MWLLSKFFCVMFFLSSSFTLLHSGWAPQAWGPTVSRPGPMVVPLLTAFAVLPRAFLILYTTQIHVRLACLFYFIIVVKRSSIVISLSRYYYPIVTTMLENW